MNRDELLVFNHCRLDYFRSVLSGLRDFLNNELIYIVRHRHVSIFRERRVGFRVRFSHGIRRQAEQGDTD